MIAEEAYALSKSFTNNSLKGIAGTLAGKNCTIKSATKADGVTTVVFAWTADDGTEKTTTIQVNDATNDYEDLINIPKIEGVDLVGNKTFADLGIASGTDLAQTDGHLQDLADVVGDKTGLPMPNETVIANIELIDTKVDGLLDDNATGLAKTFSSDKITKTFATLEEVNERIPQYSEMPPATEACGGQIAQYIGTTSEAYIRGYFYECTKVETGYEWKNIKVQPEVITTEQYQSILDRLTALEG
jgi:hypothetical protein